MSEEEQVIMPDEYEIKLYKQGEWWYLDYKERFFEFPEERAEMFLPALNILIKLMKNIGVQPEIEIISQQIDKENGTIHMVCRTKNRDMLVRSLALEFLSTSGLGKMTFKDFIYAGAVGGAIYEMLRVLITKVSEIPTQPKTQNRE